MKNDDGNIEKNQERNHAVQYIKERFSHYYKHTDLYTPSRLGKREWGFFFFDSGGMQRPVAFQTKKEIKNFLIKKCPAHVYYSSAYYERPEVPMAQKKWLGADLIFDLDADHIKGAENMRYEEMLNEVKKEFIKLIDEFLLRDFGFKEDEMLIVFSGGRGYHAHVKNPKIIQLGGHERREIVDYICGTGLDENTIFEEEPFDMTEFGGKPRVKRKVKELKVNEAGWRRRVSEGIIESIKELEGMGKDEAVQYLMSFEGVGKIIAEEIYSVLFVEKGGSRGINRLEHGGVDIFSKDVYLNPFKRMFYELGVDLKKGETDEPVTSDIKRLIRLPSSLHGKTGLKVMLLSRDKLDDFDPLRDAIPPEFSDKSVRIKVIRPFSIKLNDEKFDLKEGPTEVPEYAAIFLTCRRAAIPAIWS